MKHKAYSSVRTPFFQVDHDVSYPRNRDKIFWDQEMFKVCVERVFFSIGGFDPDLPPLQKQTKFGSVLNS